MRGASSRWPGSAWRRFGNADNPTLSATVNKYLQENGLLETPARQVAQTSTGGRHNYVRGSTCRSLLPDLGAMNERVGLMLRRTSGLLPNANGSEMDLPREGHVILVILN